MFEGEESIDTQFNRWKRKLMKSFRICFRKIRINNKKEKKESMVDMLINEKNYILKKKVKDKEDTFQIEELDKIIGEECEDKQIEKLQKVLGSLELQNGATNNTNIWKQMNKAFPKKTRPIPTGVINIEGKIITNPNEKKT